MKEDHHIEIHLALQRPDWLGHKATLPERFGMDTEELRPCPAASFGAGKISKIDLVERVNHTGEKYKRVFIHFEYWYETPRARKAKEDVLSGKDIKIMNDSPSLDVVRLFDGEVNHGLPDVQRLRCDIAMSVVEQHPLSRHSHRLQHG